MEHQGISPPKRKRHPLAVELHLFYNMASCHGSLKMPFFENVKLTKSPHNLMFPFIRISHVRQTNQCAGTTFTLAHFRRFLVQHFVSFSLFASEALKYGLLQNWFPNGSVADSRAALML